MFVNAAGRRQRKKAVVQQPFWHAHKAAMLIYPVFPKHNFLKKACIQQGATQPAPASHSPADRGWEDEVHSWWLWRTLPFWRFLQNRSPQRGQNPPAGFGPPAEPGNRVQRLIAARNGQALHSRRIPKWQLPIHSLWLCLTYWADPQELDQKSNTWEVDFYD